MLTSDVMVRAYIEQGLVQRALAGWRGMDVDLHALFPRGQVQSPKVRAFVDFLVERLRVDENYMRVLSDDIPRSGQLAAEVVATELHRVLPNAATRTIPATADGRRARARGSARLFCRFPPLSHGFARAIFPPGPGWGRGTL